MLKISNRTAFLLSLPTVIPIIIMCLEFGMPKQEFRTIVTDKRSFRGLHIYFNGASTSVSSSAYNMLAIGDSVTLKVGRIFNGVSEFYIHKSNANLKTQDSIWEFMVGIVLASPFLIFMISLIKEKNVNFSDSKSMATYILLLSVSYLVILLFIFVQVSPHK